jgi:primosomal protein N'
MLIDMSTHEEQCDGLGTLIVAGIGRGYEQCPGCEACDDTPQCPICGDPIDFCQGHGDLNASDDDA